jgi:hypothetical protein
MKCLALACAVVRALAVTGAASPARQAHSATTFTVYLGEFAQPPASLKKVPGTINQFLPGR